MAIPTHVIYDPVILTNDIVGEPSTPEEQYRHRQGYQSEGRDASSPQELYEAELEGLQIVASHWHGAPSDIDRFVGTIEEMRRFIQTPWEYRDPYNFPLLRYCPHCNARPLFLCRNMNNLQYAHRRRLHTTNPHPARKRGQLMMDREGWLG